MSFTDHTTTLDLVENWPYGFQYIGEQNPLYDYLSVHATELSRVDAFIDELYEQRFVQTATGAELDTLGAAVGVSRQATESDERLRFRITLAKAVAASNGTASDIQAILREAFGADADEIITRRVSGKPVVQFEIPVPLIEDLPLTVGAFETQLEQAFPCGYGVDVIRGDTFLLGESGDQGLGAGKLS